MCVDFTDLNVACPEDMHHLHIIDNRIDESSGYKTLSFLNACSGYNQIKMGCIDVLKTSFMSNNGNYYNAMPFGLKNVGHL